MHVSYIELSLVYNHLRISSCPWPSIEMSFLNWVMCLYRKFNFAVLKLRATSCPRQALPCRHCGYQNLSNYIRCLGGLYSIHSDVIIRPSSVQWPLRFCPATNHRTWLSLYFLFHLWGNTNNVCHSRKRKNMHTCMHESDYLSSYRWQDKEGRI